MKLLDLENGALQVWHKGVTYNVLVRRFNGHYCAYTTRSYERMDELVKAWTRIMYLYD